MGFLGLISLERVQKDGRRHQVGTASWGNMSGDQLTIQLTQPLATARVGVSSYGQNGFCSGLDHRQGLFAASVKHTGIVKSRHHGEKRVQLTDLLGASCHSPLLQLGKSVMNHMRKVVA